MNIKCGLHNKWEIVVSDKNGNVKRKGQGENIILNAFWTRYISANNATCLGYIHFGSGTTEPSASNTALTTPVGSKAAANTVTDTSNWESDGYITVQKSCRLEANEYDGETIAEVGFAYQSSTAGGLMTHSLVKDMNGNALTIEIGVDEVVDIFGTFYFAVGYTHDSGKLSFNEIIETNSLVNKFMCASAFGNSSVTYTGYSRLKLPQPFGTINNNAGIESTATATIGYDVNNKKITFTFPDVAVGSANLEGGIGSIHLHDLQIQVPCTGFAQPAIIKEVVGTGDGTTADFATDFGFIIDDESATAYVNDVEVTATFDYATPTAASASSVTLDPFMVIDATSEWTIAARNIPADEELIFENPMYESHGISTFYGKYCKAYSSPDKTTWTLAVSVSSTSAATRNIPAEHQDVRYWKVVRYGSGSTATFYDVKGDWTTITNVHLETAPSEGDTVAVTYKPGVVAKDSNHTLKNISVAFTFSEYTP